MELPVASQEPVFDCDGRLYLRREGAARELGTIFEYLTTAVIYIRALRKCQPFRISVNVQGVGEFDDVVVEMSSGGKVFQLLLQLKHKESSTFIVGQQAMAAASGQFSLKKYFESVRDMISGQTLSENTYFIMFTNAKVQLSTKDTDLDPEMYKLINTGSKTGCAYKVDINDDICSSLRKEEHAGEFFKRLIVLSNQASADILPEIVKQELNTLLGRYSPLNEKMYSTLVENVKQWWNLRGCTSYLTCNFTFWKAMKDAFHSYNKLLCHIQFRNEELLNILHKINESLSNKMLIRYNGVDSQVRSLKLLQALLKDLNTPFLFVSASELNKESPLLHMWENGWGEVLIVDMGETSVCSPVMEQLITYLLHIIDEHNRDAENPKKKLILVTCANFSMKDGENGWHQIKDQCTYMQLDESSRNLVLGHEVEFQGVLMTYASLNQERKVKEALRDEEFSKFLMSSEKHTLGGPLEVVVDTYVSRVLCRKQTGKDSETSDTMCLTEDELISKDHPTVLVTGGPGMGKSLLLTQIANKMKKRHPSHWIVKVDLLKFSLQLDGMKSKGVNKDAVFQMLASAAGVDQSSCYHLAEALLKDSVERKSNVCILCDAFDEIDPLHSNTVLSILKILRESKMLVLWITSRRVIERKLENCLSTKAFILQPFTQHDEFAFLSRSWGRKRATLVLNMVHNRISLDNGIRITSIPLQLMMLRDAYRDNFSHSSIQLNIYGLYNKFVDMQFQRYCEQKTELKPDNASANVIINNLLKEFMERHMVCSLIVIGIFEELKEHQKNYIQAKIKKYLEEIKAGKEKTGIMDGIVNGKPKFIHRTFAEYFSGLWLAEWRNENLLYIKQNIFTPRFNVISDVFNRTLSSEKPLHTAVLNCDLESLKSLLSQNMYVDDRDAGYRTALHLACQNATEQGLTIVKWVVNNNANIEAKDCILNYTPLQYAEKAEAWENVKFLLSKGAHVESDISKEECVQKYFKDEQINTNFSVNMKVFHMERTFLHKIIEDTNTDKQRKEKMNEGLGETVRFLIDHGADATIPDGNGDTPLHIAAKNRMLDVVNILVNKKVPIMATNAQGDTPLHLSVRQQYCDVSEVLLENNALTTVQNEDGDTPFHVALRGHSTELVKLLLENGASISDLDQRGDAPIHFVVRENNYAMVEFLLDNGADPTPAQKYGDNPLHIAVKNKNVDIVRILLECDTPTAAADSYGDNPLHVAVKRNCTEIVKVLLKYGADTTLADKYGECPLNIAIAEHNYDTVKVLIEHGASIYGEKPKDPPLIVAIKENRPDIVKLLLQNGAPVNEINMIANPLTVAIEGNNTEIVGLLLKYNADINTQDD